ncbi:YARHG domain-containing protein [Flavobacterium sp. NKUCC04_CG]|uniref:YARHG domain-containing protein n=1 Tax=Flavobacterium sp. NKUCC04_CG TaxID=2842121 RepID=UPI001C5AE78E|nr:YARHG domain-containing protein [Flavobacterium sp. NKUCC04_CG]MBW3520101.1 YARHG domain-containing protein [Flavobacterium sp. NKUCC04_CG]
MKFIFILALFLLSLATSAQQLSDCVSCSREKISNAQIKTKSADELRLLVNEIYARHGYRFKESRYQDYFESFNWYSSISDNQNIQLNALEKQNIAVLQQQITFLTSQRFLLTSLLKSFQTAYLSINSYDLQTQFQFKYTATHEQKNLFAVLEKLDLNDINWYKNKGLYEVTVDNGYVKINYGVRINGQKIHFIYNYREHSQIMEDFDIFTSYRSEGEHYIEWEFEYYNNELKFIRMNVAG